MAGNPQRRLKQLQAEARKQGEEPPTELPDRKGSSTAEGTWKSFADMSPEERRAAQQKGRETQKRRRQMKQAAEEHAYIEMVRENALDVLETRIEIMQSLRAKGMVVEYDADDNPTGDRYLDASKLDSSERADLLKVIEQLDKRGFGQYKGQIQVSGQVNVQHGMEAARRRMELSAGKVARLLDDGDDDGDMIEAEDAEIMDDEEE